MRRGLKGTARAICYGTVTNLVRGSLKTWHTHIDVLSTTFYSYGNFTWHGLNDRSRYISLFYFIHPRLPLNPHAINFPNTQRHFCYMCFHSKYSFYPFVLNSQSLRTISTLHHDLQQAEAASSRTPEAWQPQTATVNTFSMINITEGLGRLYLAEETTISLGVSLGSVGSSDDNSRHLQCLVPPRPAVSKKAITASLDAIKLKLTPQLPRRAISAKTTNALYKAALKIERLSL